MIRREMREITIIICDSCAAEFTRGGWYVDDVKVGGESVTTHTCSDCWWTPEREEELRNSLAPRRSR